MTQQQHHHHYIILSSQEKIHLFVHFLSFPRQGRQADAPCGNPAVKSRRGFPVHPGYQPRTRQVLLHDVLLYFAFQCHSSMVALYISAYLLYVVLLHDVLVHERCFAAPVHVVLPTAWASALLLLLYCTGTWYDSRF